MSESLATRTTGLAWGELEIEEIAGENEELRQRLKGGAFLKPKFAEKKEQGLWKSFGLRHTSRRICLWYEIEQNDVDGQGHWRQYSTPWYP